MIKIVNFRFVKMVIVFWGMVMLKSYINEFEESLVILYLFLNFILSFIIVNYEEEDINLIML